MRSSPANGTGTQPLHMLIRTDVEQQIMSGELKPGDRIPFEHELMDHYGCSRMTVNKALSALAEAGLIHRRRRAGTFVSRQRIEMAALQIPDIRETIEARGLEFRMELLSRDVVGSGAFDTDRLSLPKGGEALHLKCRHLADGKVFAIEDRLISLVTVPEARDADFGDLPPGSWLLRNVPWTEAEHKISARNAGSYADMLGVSEATACLMLHRQTWRGNAPVTDVIQIFASDCFNLSARFLSSGAGGNVPGAAK